MRSNQRIMLRILALQELNQKNSNEEVKNEFVNDTKVEDLSNSNKLGLIIESQNSELKVEETSGHQVEVIPDVKQEEENTSQKKKFPPIKKKKV